MARKTEYGYMPIRYPFMAKVKGDNGIYSILAVDWLHHNIYLDRCGGGWVTAKKIKFVDENGNQINLDDNFFKIAI